MAAATTNTNQVLKRKAIYKNKKERKTQLATLTICFLEDVFGSNTVLYKGIRHRSSYFIYSFQARAMARNHESGLQFRRLRQLDVFHPSQHIFYLHRLVPLHIS